MIVVPEVNLVDELNRLRKENMRLGGARYPKKATASLPASRRGLSL